MTDMGVIVLAGGTGERLGGYSKADLEVGGRRFLDVILAELRRQSFRERSVVVVAPASVQVPAGVLQTMEEPAGGGPVAGVLAGLQLLREHHPQLARVAVLTCDAPFGPLALPHLTAAMAAGADGVAAAGQFTEYLLAIYRVQALARRAEEFQGRDVSARRFFGDMAVATVGVPEVALHDVDTGADLERLSGFAGIELVEDVLDERPHHADGILDAAGGAGGER